MRRSDFNQIALEGRHAGELLIHPCACGHHRCELGPHLLDATRDMTPGPKAQSFEPAMANGHVPHDGDPRPDPTHHIATQYEQLVRDYRNASRNLIRFIDANRPDRWTPLPAPATDEDWCRHHLETIGTCEPRYRGDLCRACYEINLTYCSLPDAQLMRVRHDLGYTPDAAVKEWELRQPRANGRKRKQAS